VDRAIEYWKKKKSIPRVQGKGFKYLLFLEVLATSSFMFSSKGYIHNTYIQICIVEDFVLSSSNCHKFSLVRIIVLPLLAGVRYSKLDSSESEDSKPKIYR